MIDKGFRFSEFVLSWFVLLPSVQPAVRPSGTFVFLVWQLHPTTCKRKNSQILGYLLYIAHTLNGCTLSQSCLRYCYWEHGTIFLYARAAALARMTHRMAR